MAKVTIYPPIRADEDTTTLVYIGEGVNMTYYGRETGTRYRVSPGIPFEARTDDAKALLAQKSSASIGVAFRKAKKAEVAAVLPSAPELPLPPVESPSTENPPAEPTADAKAAATPEAPDEKKSGSGKGK